VVSFFSFFIALDGYAGNILCISCYSLTLDPKALPAGISEEAIKRSELSLDFSIVGGMYWGHSYLRHIQIKDSPF